MTHESQFNKIKSSVDPRAFVSGIVSFPNGADEDPTTNTPRTISIVDATQYDNYTSHYFYEYESIPSAVIPNSPPVSYGRSNGRDPDSGVFVDTDSDGLIDTGSNVVAIRMPRAHVIDASNPSQYESSTQLVVGFSTFNQWGQKVFDIDPEGSVSRCEYYPEPWNASTAPNGGYLKLVVNDTNLTDTDVDVLTGQPTVADTGSNFALTASFAYNLVGDRTSMTDARGNTRLYEYNALRLLTKATEPAPFSYEVEDYYDGNNNPVLHRVQNVVANDSNGNGFQDNSSEQQTGALKTWIETRTTYTPEDQKLSVIVDAGTGTNPDLKLETVFKYDGELNLVEIVQPEGNRIRKIYNYEDSLVQEIHGYGSSDTEVVSYIRDLNGNLIQSINAHGHVYTTLYDGHFRTVGHIDPDGNRVDISLDLAGHVVYSKSTGRVGGPGSTHVILSQSYSSYDEMGRLTQTDVDHFVPGTSPSALPGGTIQGPIPHAQRTGVLGNLSTQLVVYNKRSQAVATFDAMGAESSIIYDALGRATRTTVDNGSYMEEVYDANSNVIRKFVYEVADTGSSNDESFTFEYFYDSLDRLAVAVTPSKNAARYLYNSRDLVVQIADAESTSASDSMSSFPNASEHGSFPQGASGISGRGNTLHFEYDLGDKVRETTLDLRANGVGGGSVTGTLATRNVYDRNERLISKIDDKGNATIFEYDSVNRLTRTQFADGSQQTMTYDAAGNVLSTTDPRGVQKSFTYDNLERVTQVDISNNPSGPGQTTFKKWVYDGASRPIQSEDNDSRILRSYSSFSSVLSETQLVGSINRSSPIQVLVGTTRTVAFEYDGKGRRTALVYPYQSTPGYRNDYTYDSLDRVTIIVDRINSSVIGLPVVSYSYIGADSRRLMRTSHSTVPVSQLFSYDSSKRVVRLDTLNTGNQRLCGYTYAWTKSNRRRYERTLVNNSNPTEVTGAGSVFEYDSAYRLVRHRAGVASTTLDTFANNSSQVPGAFAATDDTQWSIDGANNWLSITKNGVTQTFSANSTDAALNQYTVAQGLTRTHDAGGNVATDGSNAFTWDADNRMTQCVTATDTIQYRYDVDGRRISKRSVASTPVFEEIIYFYDGWSALEEYRRSQSTPLRRFVYGPTVDEPIKVTQTEFGGTLMAPLTLWFHTNSLGSVTALGDANGLAVERYEYEAYGAYATMTDGAGFTISQSQYGNVYGFTARRLELEEGTGLYHFRNRTYDPVNGRFVSRDPIGIWGDSNNKGNGQAYCNNDPINNIDPYGLETQSFTDGFFQGMLEGGSALLDSIRNLKMPELTMDALKSLLWEALKGVAARLVGSYWTVLWALYEFVTGTYAEYKELADKGGCAYSIGVMIGKRFVQLGVSAALGTVFKKFIELLKGLAKGAKGVFTAARDKFQKRGGGNSSGSNAQRSASNGKKNSSKSKNCFVAGTLVLMGCGVLTPIEDIEIGQRVATREYLEGRDSDSAGREQNLRIITLDMPEIEGECKLLRSEDWINEYYDSRTNTLFLSLSEMGIRGRFKVVSVEKPGPIGEGPGQLVTMTIKHPSPFVWRLVVEGASKPLLGTGYHKFWSETRQAWVSLKSLKIGESLRLSSGERAEVQGLERNPGEFWVYNFEVQQYHNYYVTAHRSDPGALVHNQGCDGDGGNDGSSSGSKTNGGGVSKKPNTSNGNGSSASSAVEKSLKKLKGVPWGQYRPSGCEKVAEKIKKAIGGKVYKITPKRGRRLGPRSGHETEWYNHEAVVKDGRVYDALTGPGGLSIPDYKKSWEYASDLNFGF